MEIIGKLKQIMPQQSGQSANGTWVRGCFVIETQEQYSKTVAFSTFGDKAAIADCVPVGALVKVLFNPESREYNGRWYTDLKCYKIETYQSTPATQQAYQPQYQQQQQPTQTPPQAVNLMPEDNDLPF